MLIFNLCFLSGESKIDKCKPINSMFLTGIYSGEYPELWKRATKTFDVHSTDVTLKEKMSIFLPQWLKDSLDNMNSW